MNNSIHNALHVLAETGHLRDIGADDGGGEVFLSDRQSS